MAHILQRAIAAGLKSSGMDELLLKCRKIVGHFKHSLQTAQLEQASQDLQINNLCLIQDVTTRWFSVLAMAERLVSQKDAVEKVLNDNACADKRLTDFELTRLETLFKLFTPLKEISDLLGGQNYVTGSVVVHAIRKLEKFLICTADDPMYISSFKKAFSSYMSENIRLPPIFKVCALLDLRFKKQRGMLQTAFC